MYVKMRDPTGALQEIQPGLVSELRAKGWALAGQPERAEPPAITAVEPSDDPAVNAGSNDAETVPSVVDVSKPSTPVNKGPFRPR